jgi:hypothetical protein
LLARQQILGEIGMKKKRKIPVQDDSRFLSR